MYGGLHLLRVLPQTRISGRLRSELRRSLQEGGRDSRTGWQWNPDAGRSPSRFAVGMVRGASERTETALLHSSALLLATRDLRVHTIVSNEHSGGTATITESRPGLNSRRRRRDPRR